MNQVLTTYYQGRELYDILSCQHIFQRLPPIHDSMPFLRNSFLSITDPPLQYMFIHFNVHYWKREKNHVTCYIIQNLKYKIHYFYIIQNYDGFLTHYLATENAPYLKTCTFYLSNSTVDF